MQILVHCCLYPCIQGLANFYHANETPFMIVPYGYSWLNTDTVSRVQISVRMASLGSPHTLEQYSCMVHTT